MFRRCQSCPQIRGHHVHQQRKRIGHRSRRFPCCYRQNSTRFYLDQIRRLRLRQFPFRQNRARLHHRRRNHTIRRASQIRRHLRRRSQLTRLSPPPAKALRRRHPHLQTQCRPPPAIRQCLRPSRRSLHGLRRQNSRHSVLRKIPRPQPAKLQRHRSTQKTKFPRTVAFRFSPTAILTSDCFLRVAGIDFR